MLRRILLAAVMAASIAGVGGTPSASAHCSVNLRTCAGGHCRVNLGDCRGSCYVNAAECRYGEECTVKSAACTEVAELVGEAAYHLLCVWLDCEQ